MTRISFVNGNFIDHDKAFVHIEDRGFQFADGAYEVILYSNNKLIDDKPHINRLFRSLGEINIKHQLSYEYIIKNIVDLFNKNNLSDGFVYMQVTRGATNRVPFCPKELDVTVIMTVSQTKTYTHEEFINGLSLVTMDDIRWHRCDIKTTGLLASTLCNQKAKDLGFDDALFVRNQVITEATYSNFFVIDNDNNLVTKPSDNNILEGITRNRIIAIAKENKFNVIEKNFDLSFALSAQEAFLTSSTLGIRPVSKINNFAIGRENSRNISLKLSSLYKEFCKN